MYCAAGKWHSLVFGVLWHKESEGWLKVWFDKEVVLNKQNLQTILDVDDRLFQFRVSDVSLAGLLSHI